MEVSVDYWPLAILPITNGSPLKRNTAVKLPWVLGFQMEVDRWWLSYLNSIMHFLYLWFMHPSLHIFHHLCWAAAFYILIAIKVCIYALLSSLAYMTNQLSAVATHKAYFNRDHIMSKNKSSLSVKRKSLIGLMRASCPERNEIL